MVNLSVIVTFAFTQYGELVFNIYFITLFFVILGAPLLGLPFYNEILVTLITVVAYVVVAAWFQHMV